MLHRFESKKDLEGHLRGERNSVLIGADAESPRRYYALNLAEKTGAQMKIGIVSSFHGIDPSWIFSVDAGVLVIGHDTSITFIDVAKHHVALVRNLDGVFFEFISEVDHARFLVLHELGVARFDFSGNELWSVATPDIAESAQIRDSQTVVVQHQGPGKEFTIDILTGQIKSNPARS
jgi:hypothetical protein